MDTTNSEYKLQIGKFHFLLKILSCVSVSFLNRIVRDSAFKTEHEATTKGLIVIYRSVCVHLKKIAGLKCVSIVLESYSIDSFV